MNRFIEAITSTLRLSLATALAAIAFAADARDPQWVFNHGPDAPLAGVGQGVTLEALGLFRIYANGTDLTFTVPYEKEDAFKAEERPFFAVRYRIRSAMRQGGLFFVTDTLKSLSDKSYSQFRVTPDGEWHNLVVDMRVLKPEYWKGTVYEFRLDPTNPSAPGDKDEISRLGFFSSREAAEAFLAQADDTEDYSREVVLQGKRCRALIPGGTLSRGWREADFLLDGTEPPAGAGALTVVRDGEVVPTYVNSRGFVFYVAEKPGRYALARCADVAKLRRPGVAAMQSLGYALSDRAKAPSHFARERLRIGAWGLFPDGAGWSRAAVSDFAECGFDFLVANSKDSGCGDRLFTACDEEGIEVVFNAGLQKSERLELGREFADHPSLGGFYLIDEPGTDFFAHYGEMARAYARETGKRPFINLLPMYANAAQLKFGAQAAAIKYYDKDPKLYRKYCEAYCDKIDTDYICTDIYPLHIRQGRATSYRDYVESVNVIASVARERGREFWCCIQTFAWNPYVRTPNAAEFRWQCYTLLSFGCRALLCWHYPGSSQWPSLVTFRGERTAAWYDARRVLNEVKALSDVYCAYRNVGAFTHNCTDETPYLKMTGELRSFAPIKSVKCDSPLLFGCFEAKSGRGSAFTVVNMSDLEKGRSALVRLDVAGGRVTVYGRGAPQEARRGVDGLYEIPLECGEGVFVTVDDAPASRMDRTKLQIGAYCLAPYARTEAHVRDVKGCGVDFVYGVPASDRRTLDLCAKYGLGVIATGGVPFWHGMGGEQAGQMRKLRPMDSYAKALAAYEDHPAIWLLDYIDEPSALDYPYIGEVTEFLKGRLPSGVTPYINLYPNYASVVGNTSRQTRNQLGTATYAEHVAEYVKHVGLDYICFDFYLYSARGANRAPKLRQFYGNFRDVARACRETGKSLWYIPQVNSSYGELWLSENMLRFQAFLAMAFGAEQIDWACWSRSASGETADMPGLTGWWTNNVLTLTGEKTEQYAKLRRVNAEIHRLGEKYMAYRTVATHYDDGFGAVVATDGSHVTVGEMVPRAGDASRRAYFVLASDDPFDEGAKRHVYELKAAGVVSATGKDGPVEVKPAGTGVWRFELKSNECALVEVRTL